MPARPGLCRKGKVDETTAAARSKDIVQNLDPALMECSSPDIPALLAQAQQGDPDAFGLLCRAFEPRLLRQAILLSGDVSLAEDLSQETLAEAWKSLGRYDGRCQFFTWLCAILHHRHYNAWRRKRLVFLFGWGRSQRDETPGIPEQHPDDEVWPDQAAQSREQAALVRRCVQALPAKQQQVVYLRFFVDHSLEGIAVALHCSVGTVKSRLFHAVENLRRMPALHEGRADFSSKINIL